jgi:hypothetical protein
MLSHPSSSSSGYQSLLRDVIAGMVRKNTYNFVFRYASHDGALRYAESEERNVRTAMKLDSFSGYDIKRYLGTEQAANIKIILAKNRENYGVHTTPV